MDKVEFKEMLKEVMLECFKTGEIKLELNTDYDEDSILYNQVVLSIGDETVIKQRIMPIKC